MNYRVDSKHQPIKRIQLRPMDLLAKSPASIRSSCLSVWTRRIIHAAETSGVGLATWLRGRIQMGRQIIKVRLQGMALGKRIHRYGVVLVASLSWALRTGRQRCIKFGQAGLGMSRNMTQAITSWIRSRLVCARQHSGIHPALQWEADATGPRSLHLSSPREHDLRRELTEAHARLVEELLSEEEELTRVSTRVVRLQSLIRSQEHLLAEMACHDENLMESSQFPAATVDDLVGVGKSSSGGELRRTPIPWRS
jgi:hypothetical protein